MSDKTFHPGGVHPPQDKLTAGDPIVDFPLPRKVTLLMSQHIGAPAKSIVKRGDKVTRGQMIAEACGFVSAPVHTPITGTVSKVDRVRDASGRMADAVIIEADDADAAFDKGRKLQPLRTFAEAMALDPKQIIDEIGNAGVVGLGGATFPTRVKLSPPPGSKAEVLIINGAECEPYLTNDDALMRARSSDIIGGVKLLMRAAGVDKAIIGIESNKPDAIWEMSRAVMTDNSIDVVTLPVKYPQGSEKQLIQALTGKEVPSGALPIATGAIVQNVATACAVYDAVVNGQPVIERIVTVTGKYFGRKIGNYRVAVGTDIQSILDALFGGLPREAGKVILGGPMMGRSVDNLNAPTTKGTSGILMLHTDESSRRPVEPCIRCGACVEACPMGLEPYLLATQSRLSMWDDAEANKVMNCVECGSCSYSCPASRPILDYIRLGKNKVGAAIRARKSPQTPSTK